MSGLRAATLAFCLLVPALCGARPAAFATPSLANMRRDAVESTNITVGPVLLWFASRVISSRNSHSAATKKLLRGLHKVQVHSYRYSTDHVYNPADLEALRLQLEAPGWHRMVQVRDARTKESVDVYYTQDRDTVTGMVVVAAEAREFTLVNISGRIDLRDVEAIGDKFVPHAGAEHQLALSEPNPAIDSGEHNQPTAVDSGMTPD